jgi:hypothetical protein
MHRYGAVKKPLSGPAENDNAGLIGPAFREMAIRSG